MGRAGYSDRTLCGYITHLVRRGHYPPWQTDHSGKIPYPELAHAELLAPTRTRGLTSMI